MRITDENTEDDNDLEAAALVDSGYEYNSLGQYERAIQDFDEAIRLNPQNAGAYHNRGIAYGRIGKSIEEERDFAKATEIGYSP